MSRKSILQLNGIYRNGKVILSWYKSTPLFEARESKEFKEFCIFRKKIPGFVFGQDYEEYFCDYYGNLGKAIYKGKIRCENNRKFIFYDQKIKTGDTYIYFVKTRSSKPVGPVPVRIRDPEVWWPYKKVLKKIERLKEKFSPVVSIGFCGKTSEGRKIPFIVAGKGRSILGLVGTIHAGESGPELIIPAIEGLLKNKPDIFKKVRIIAIPSVNIDSREKMVEGVPWYIRKSAVGVDINRNFPADWDTIEYGYGLNSSEPLSATYRGRYPASENETMAVIKLFSKYRPRAVFSFHCLASICGLPAIASAIGKGNKTYQEECKKIISLYGQGLYPGKTYSDKWLSFSSSSGSLPRWFFRKYKIPCFDLELSSKVDKKAYAKCRIDKTERILLKDYQLRHQQAIENVLSNYI